jgi:response regulator RpfG family c-di-GMP phosphodiesterase
MITTGTETIKPLSYYTDILSKERKDDNKNEESIIRLLIIENDIISARIMLYQLGRLHLFDIKLASVGKEGLELMNSFSPQIIVMDTIMVPNVRTDNL